MMIFLVCWRVVFYTQIIGFDRSSYVTMLCLACLRTISYARAFAFDRFCCFICKNDRGSSKTIPGSESNIKVERGLRKLSYAFVDETLLLLTTSSSSRHHLAPVDIAPVHKHTAGTASRIASVDATWLLSTKLCSCRQRIAPADNAQNHCVVVVLFKKRFPRFEYIYIYIYIISYFIIYLFILLCTGARGGAAPSLYINKNRDIEEG